MFEVPYGQDPYNAIGRYIRENITAIEDIIAVIDIDGVETNELFMVDMKEDGFFIWKSDWYEGEKKVVLIDFFPVSEAINSSVQSDVLDTNVGDIISRQAAIDVLEKTKTVISEDGERYVAKINAQQNIALLPSAQPEQQWIPCSEWLPEEEKASYWVCTDAGYQFECRWTNVNHLFTNLTMKWHWHVMDVPQYSTVVAWMPLPEPYKPPTRSQYRRMKEQRGEQE